MPSGKFMEVDKLFFEHLKKKKPVIPSTSLQNLHFA